jgi:hypothetical protein
MTLDECKRLQLHDLVVSSAHLVRYGRVVGHTQAGFPVISFEDESYLTVAFPSQAASLRHVPHWKDLPPARPITDVEDDAA